MTGPSGVWELPLALLTLAQVAEQAKVLVETRKPSFLITVNVHYAMLTQEMSELRDVNARASFLIVDGVPLVWPSRWNRRPLPERVAGVDLIFALCEMAARQDYRVFFLGGASKVAEDAARRLAERYPGLAVVGTESPPFRDSRSGMGVPTLARTRSSVSRYARNAQFAASMIARDLARGLFRHHSEGLASTEG